MAEDSPTPTRIDRRRVGEAIQVGDRTVQPVARVSGRIGAGGSGTAGGAGGMLTVQPVEVLVREADGAQSTLAIGDPNAQALRGMASAAAAVAVLSGIFMLLARLLRRAGRAE
jgi:uncharacterized spore protein YtfJ